MWEGNLIRTLVMGMNRTLESKESLEKKKNVLMDYLITHVRVSQYLRLTLLLRNSNNILVTNRMKKILLI